MKLSLSKLFLFAVLIMCSSTLLGQSNISGTVLDANNQPIPGATVLDANDSTNGTVTDFDGNFSINMDQNWVLNVT